MSKKQKQSKELPIDNLPTIPAPTNTSSNEVKEYIVIYESEEHYEVLGFVTASSLKEAIEKAQTELKDEAQYYNVVEAEIAEYKDAVNIIF